MTKNKPQTVIDRGARIRLLRHLAQISIKDISKKYQIPEATLKYWEYAQGYGLSRKGAKQLIELFQKEGIITTYQWLMNGDGEFPSKEAPNKNRPRSTSQREIALFLSIDDRITLDIKDDSMVPYFLPGDILGADLCPVNEINALTGKPCISELPNNILICRKLIREGIDSYNLVAENNESKAELCFIPNPKIKRLYAITRIWRKKPFE